MALEVCGTDNHDHRLIKLEQIMQKIIFLKLILNI